MSNIVNKGAFRFILLLFNCLVTFGPFFCSDVPSVLQHYFTCPLNCNTSTNASHALTTAVNPKMCSGECLGMNETQYNLLYTVYAWMNAVVVICAGFVIDKLGVQFGLLFFSFLCLIGSVTIAVGLFFKSTNALLPIMLVGRLLFGSGYGSLTVVQNKTTSFWFKNKELALAFGITLAFSRLGSVSNFLITESFADMFGLKWTLWAASSLTGLGFIAAIVVGMLDRIGAKQLGVSSRILAQSRGVTLSDIKSFTTSYWLLTLTIVFFYNSVYPFIADASKFITIKYSFENDRTPAYIAGAVYNCSLLLLPLLGGLIDVIGKRAYLILISSVMTIPVFGTLAFTNWYPLIATIWLGITYSVIASTTWSSIPLVVKESVVGTAMGISTSIQMIGTGLCSLIVGFILERNDDSVSRNNKLLRWKYVMIFLMANTAVCVVAGVFLNIKDRHKNGFLNISRKHKEEQQLLYESENLEEQDPLIENKATKSYNTIN